MRKAAKKTPRASSRSLPDRRVDIICKTVGRYDSVNALYRSIPEGARLIVCDDDNPTPKMERLFAEMKEAGHIGFFLPFDSGVSAGRNSCVGRSSAPYICAVDDDFMFTDNTDFSIPVQVLEALPQVGVIGGLLYEYGLRQRHHEYNIEVWNGTLCRVLVRPHRPEVTKCDGVLNYLMCRREIFDEVKWDERIKTGWEHDDFFMMLKAQTKWEVRYCPYFTAEHWPCIPSKKYEKLRKRRSFKKIFTDKWGITNPDEVWAWPIPPGKKGLLEEMRCKT